MKKDKVVFDVDGVIRLLKEEVQKAGGQTQWARNVGVHREDVNKALHGRCFPTLAIIKALELEKVYDAASEAEPRS